MLNSEFCIMTDCIILAGGKGTRLRNVVSDVPKPMAPINGRPFLEIQLEYLATQNIGRVILASGHMSEKITGHFGHTFHGMQILHQVEEKPLGTGGAILRALRLIETETFLLINGDTFFPINLDKLIEFYKQNGANADMLIAAFAADKADRYGALSLQKDVTYLEKLSTQKAPIGSLANGGTYLCNTQKWLELSQDIDHSDFVSVEDDLISLMLHQGAKILVKKFSEPLIDIGVPEDYSKAQLVLE